VSNGFLRRIVVSHDHVPYFYGNYMKVEKGINAWKKGNPDYTLVSKKLVTSLKKLDMSDSEIRTILVENPQRCLAF
jgi:predicted metal-dependent phosphotriesterase family hydrolase